MELGTWGEWAAAIGTVAAVVVALGLELSWRKRLARSEEERQARRVSAWIETQVEVNAEHQAIIAQLRVVNRSEEPCWQPRITIVSGPNDEVGLWTRRSLPPNFDYSSNVSISMDLARRGDTGEVTSTPLRFTFTDANGTHWERLIPAGTLRKLAIRQSRRQAEQGRWGDLRRRVADWVRPQG